MSWTPDETHVPGLTSWVASANGHRDFPIQNLPFGVFAPATGGARGGVAIGDMILDLRALHAARILDGLAQKACGACIGTDLNPLLTLDASRRNALRKGISRVLAEGSTKRPELLHRSDECTMHMPARVGDYTDFYAGFHHATNVGKLFRPDNPLLPNYKWVPIGYHGRASSLLPSGVAFHRPCGQRKASDMAEPIFGPCERLDFELELGIWVGPGNALGEPIPVAEARDHIAGYCLLNDWSARDIQTWEYQPLGPFLAKSFATTVSPWIVTPEALAPFRAAQPKRPQGDPRPLPYLMDLEDQANGALGIRLEAFLLTPAMRLSGAVPYKLTDVSALHLYWTPAQLLAHQSSNGCHLRPGDLLGTGTISGPELGSFGSLLEITAGGRHWIEVSPGERRLFLEDGDAVILRGLAEAEGFVSIGFGECVSVVEEVVVF